jgi:hypothetical protein
MYAPYSRFCRTKGAVALLSLLAVSPAALPGVVKKHYRTQACCPAESEFFGYYPTCWRLWPPGGPVCPPPVAEPAAGCPVGRCSPIQTGLVPAGARLPAKAADGQPGKQLPVLKEDSPVHSALDASAPPSSPVKPPAAPLPEVIRIPPAGLPDTRSLESPDQIRSPSQ